MRVLTGFISQGNEPVPGMAVFLIPEHSFSYHFHPPATGAEALDHSKCGGKIGTIGCSACMTATLFAAGDILGKGTVEVSSQSVRIDTLRAHDPL